MIQVDRLGPGQQSRDGAAIIGVSDHHSFRISGGSARVADDAEITRLRWVNGDGRVGLAGFDEVLEVEHGDAFFFG